MKISLVDFSSRMLVSLIVMLCCTGAIQAQDEVVEELNDKYSEAEFAAKHAVYELEFEVDKRSEEFCPITVNQIMDYDVYCLEVGAIFNINATYGFKSELDNHRLLDLNSTELLEARSECISNYSREIFSSDVTTCFTRKWCDYGDEVEVDYELSYSDALFFPRLVLQQRYPIDELQVVITVPNEIELDIFEINMGDMVVNKDVEEKRKEKIITLTINEVPARVEEHSMKPGATWHLAHLAFVPRSVVTRDGKKEIFSSLDQQYEWYQDLLGEVKENPEYVVELKSIVDELVEEGMTDQQKIEAIYYWIQENIRYIANEDGIMGYKPFSAGEVCTNRFGDCKGMSNLLKAMLVDAGFDARLAWIGTTRISDKYNYRFPSLANDNHMICALKTDTGFVYLDPTEDFLAYGTYANRIQGRKIMIEAGDDFVLEEVPFEDEINNGIVLSREMSFEGDSLIIDEEMVYKGSFRLGVLRDIASIGSDLVDDAVKSFLKAGNKNRTILEYTTSNLDDRESDFVFDHREVLENNVERDQGHLVMSMDILRYWGLDSVSLDRTQPYYQGSRKRIVFEDKILLPEGFKVTYVPESFVTDNEAFSAAFKVTEKEGSLMVDQEFVFKKEVFELEELEFYNEMVEDYVSRLSELIVLEKK